MDYESNDMEFEKELRVNSKPSTGHETAGPQNTRRRTVIRGRRTRKKNSQTAEVDRKVNVLKLLPGNVPGVDAEGVEVVAKAVLSHKEKWKIERRPPDYDWFGEEAEEESRKRKERLKELFAIIDNGTGKYADLR